MTRKTNGSSQSPGMDGARRMPFCPSLEARPRRRRGPALPEDAVLTLASKPLATATHDDGAATESTRLHVPALPQRGTR